jgi:hypothetical protein
MTSRQTSLNGVEIDRMAWKISTHGFDGVTPAVLRELGFEARRAGINVAMTDALVDTATPLVVRQRIFGHIAARLAQWRDSAARAGANGTVGTGCAA